MKKSTLFVLVQIALCIPPSFGKYISYQNISIDDSLKIIEKVYLHVDRDRYYPGDDIWFKAYLIDATDRLLSSHSINLHVELISPDLKIIDSRVIKLDNGLGNGDFHLSEKLQSGRYRLRAYTNYMRNFGDELFFNKDFAVINSSNAIKAFSDSGNYIINKMDIRFFPEGGSLVDNVTSVVAFKAEDDHGYSHDVSGEIYSSTGEKVTEFKNTHNGMGKFMLNPGAGLRYYAVIRNRNGDMTRYEIPQSFPLGVVLSVSKNRACKMLLTFKTNPATLPLVLDYDLSLTVSAPIRVLKTFSFRMKSLDSFLNLPTDDLPDGIVRLTLSGLDNIPLCERLVYLKNSEDIKINLEAGKRVYNQRDSVCVKISLKTNSDIPQNVYLSLSATGEIFADNPSRFPSTISSWFLLESDVRGPVEEPSYYFDQSNPNRLKDLDLLLLTQGWRDFKWKYVNKKYEPENGFTISGRVRKKLADLPVKNAWVNIGIFDKGKPYIINIPADSSGRFYLKGVDLTGSVKLVASVTGDKDNLKGWLLLDSAGYSPASVTNNITRTKFNQNNEQFTSKDQFLNENQFVKNNLHNFIQYAEIKNSIRKKYKLSDTITPGEVTITAKRQDWTESPVTRSRHYLMGTPDHELKITPLEKAYGTAYNLVNSYYLSQVNVPRWAYNPRIQYPLYLIDGMRAELDEVKALSLEWVERIDVVKNSAALLSLRTQVEFEYIDKKGNIKRDFRFADGVISIILKDNIPDTHIYNSAAMNFSGYNEPRIFYSPRHKTTLESDYKPDLRTTLLWEPDIKLENQKDLFLNYYNADNSSSVRIFIEGITDTGIPVTGTTEYEVK